MHTSSSHSKTTLFHVISIILHDIYSDNHRTRRSYWDITPEKQQLQTLIESIRWYLRILNEASFSLSMFSTQASLSPASPTPQRKCLARGKVHLAFQSETLSRGGLIFIPKNRSLIKRSPRFPHGAEEPQAILMNL